MAESEYENYSATSRNYDLSKSICNVLELVVIRNKLRLLVHVCLVRLRHKQLAAMVDDTCSLAA